VFVHVDASGACSIADATEPLLSNAECADIDPVSAAEFRLTGYTTGRHTLHPQLQQVPSGHVLRASGKTIDLLRYYAYRHVDSTSLARGSLIAQLASLHERVFRRLLQDVAGRPLAVPLSGGHDSRLVGTMLRDLGYRDVVCYTYGLEGNWEARISEQLARYLGYRWVMVPYSATSWRRWHALPAFRRYFREAGNACASPHFQDWPAVHELHAARAIDLETVFVPGHTGDFLTGGHIPRSLVSSGSISRERVLKALFARHYSLWDWPRDDDGRLRAALVDRVEAVVGRIADGSADAAADTFEAWECAERQAKFIVNSVRVYEAFGYEWRLPLFDAELMDFWARVPLRERFGRALYFAYEKAHQTLPVAAPNSDHATPLAAAWRLIDLAGLKPLANLARRRLRRLLWQREYAGGTIGWFALVEIDDFRRRYTGREIGHSFFAAQYLASLVDGR
jgi:asparagine synthase (glutamine-hydrolysing)